MRPARVPKHSFQWFDNSCQSCTCTFWVIDVCIPVNDFLSDVAATATGVKQEVQSPLGQVTIKQGVLSVYIEGAHFCRSRAAAPVTWGAAMEVPDSNL